MTWWKRNSDLWSKNVVHRYARKALSENEARLHSLRSRCFSKSNSRSAQHKDDDGSDRPDGLSDLEWMQLQQFRRWKKLLEERPYDALFGYSNRLLAGRGGIKGAWLSQAFPKWMLDEFGFDGSNRGKSNGSGSDSNGKPQSTESKRVDNQDPAALTRDNISESTASQHATASKPAFTASYTSITSQKPLYSTGIESPSDNRRPRETTISDSGPSSRPKFEHLKEDPCSKSFVNAEKTIQTSDAETDRFPQSSQASPPAATAGTSSSHEPSKQLHTLIPSDAEEAFPYEPSQSSVFYRDDITGKWRWGDLESSSTPMKKNAQAPESSNEGSPQPVTSVQSADNVQSSSEARHIKWASHQWNTLKEKGVGNVTSDCGVPLTQKSRGTSVGLATGDLSTSPGMNAANDWLVQPGQITSWSPQVKERQSSPGAKPTRSSTDSIQGVSALKRSTSEILNTLPKDDIDFLRPSDVRASMGRRASGVKESNEEKEKTRSRLENEYERTSLEEIDLISFRQSKKALAPEQREQKLETALDRMGGFSLAKDRGTSELVSSKSDPTLKETGYVEPVPIPASDAALLTEPTKPLHRTLGFLEPRQTEVSENPKELGSRKEKEKSEYVTRKEVYEQRLQKPNVESMASKINDNEKEMSAAQQGVLVDAQRKGLSGGVMKSAEPQRKSVQSETIRAEGMIDVEEVAKPAMKLDGNKSGKPVIGMSLNSLPAMDGPTALRDTIARGLEKEIRHQKAAMRGLSDDGYSGHSKSTARRASFTELSALQNSLFRPFNKQLDNLGKEAEEPKIDVKKARKEAQELAEKRRTFLADQKLVQEVRAAYEDRYGQITVDHRQGDSSTSNVAAMKEIHGVGECGEVSQSAKVDGGLKTASGARSTAEGNPSTKSPSSPGGTTSRTISAASAIKSKAPLETSLERRAAMPATTTEPTKLIEEEPHSASNVNKTQRSDEQSSTRTTIESEAPQPLATQSKTPSAYKILAFDPETDNLTITTTTPPPYLKDPNEPVSLAIALSNLSNPTKFLPHLPSSYEPIAATSNLLIIRETSVDLGTKTEIHKTRGVNPVDGTTIPLPEAPTGNFASPTGFVNHDAIEREQMKSSPKPRQDVEESMGYKEWESRTRDELETQARVLNGSYQREKGRRSGRVVQVLRAGIWAGTICYLAGVVGELMK